MDASILVDLATSLQPFVPNATALVNQFLTDESFREMCSEYEAGAKCLHRLEQSPEKATERIEEYVELLADLRREILGYLQEHGNS